MHLKTNVMQFTCLFYYVFFIQCLLFNLSIFNTKVKRTVLEQVTESFVREKNSVILANIEMVISDMKSRSPSSFIEAENH